MKKVFYYLLLVSLLLNLVACSDDTKQVDKAVQVKENLYVKVAASNGELLTADAIILLNEAGKIVSYQQGQAQVEFTGFKTGTYQLVVAKEGYELYKSDLLTFTGDEANTLQVKLNQQDNTIPVTIDVCNQAGSKLEEAKVEVLKEGKLVAKKTTTEGKVVVNNIYPGVFYQYKVQKSGYLTYQNTLLTLAEESDYLQVSLQQGNKRIFTNEAKELTLGTLAQGESAIIAVSPLDINYTSTYDAALEVDFIADKQSNLLGAGGNDNRNGKLQTSQASRQQQNLAQQKLDHKLRNLEKKLISNQTEQQLRKQLSSRGQAVSYQLGATRKFKVGSLSDPKEITATLQGQGKHVSIFVANKTTVAQQKIDKMVAAFDNQIYPSNMKYFAQHSYNYYDKDHNGRSIILITDLGGSPANIVLGYFHPVDYKASSDYPRSNQADMFYINSKLLKYITEGEFDLEQHLLGTLAHEFQHLIFYVEKLLAYDPQVGGVNDVWLNEGLSGLAEYLSGYYQYQQDNRIYNHYFNQPAKESVLSWNNELSDYGASNLFALYLYDQFGPKIIEKINTTYQPPVEIIADQSSREFSELLLDWGLTNYISDNKPGNNLHSYAYPDNLYHSPIKLKSKPDYGYRNNEVIDQSGVFELEVDSTAFKYYKIQGDGRKVNIDVNFPITPERIGVTIKKHE